MNKKISIIVIFLSAAMFTHSQDIYTKYLEEAKSFFVIKDYDKAMSRIQFILKTHENPEKLPEEEKALAEKIYYSYLKALSDKKEYASIESFTSSNIYYKGIAELSSRITELRQKNDVILESIKREEDFKKVMAEEKRRAEEIEASKKAAEEKYRQEMERIEAEKRQEIARVNEERRKELNRLAEERRIENDKMLAAENARRKQDEAAKRAEQENLMKLQEQLNRERLLSESSSKEQVDSIIQTFVTMREKESTVNYKLIIAVTIVIGSIIFMLLAAVVLVFIISYRNSRKQQEAYMQYTDKIVNQPYRDALPSPVMTDVADAVYRIEDRSSSDGLVDNENKTRSLPSPEDHEKEKLRLIIEQCKSFGEAIDNATQRKNCSKNAAELVYKISVLLGKSTKESMIYYAVGLVYDIGFLSIDPVLLDTPKLNDEQFEQIKKHTTAGLHMIHFVDKEYKQTFIDGITKHHENMDGSGYPESLKGKDIPYIARVIRIVDSYVSMISTRVYRNIYDKETAFKKMLEDKGAYDEKIMEALSNII